MINWEGFPYGICLVCDLFEYVCGCNPCCLSPRMIRHHNTEYLRVLYHEMVGENRRPDGREDAAAEYIKSYLKEKGVNL